jgi:hypothetical protein
MLDENNFFSLDNLVGGLGSGGGGQHLLEWMHFYSFEDSMYGVGIIFGELRCLFEGIGLNNN